MNAKTLVFSIAIFLVIFSFSNVAQAKINTLNVTISEIVSETYAYNPQMGEYGSGNATWNWTYVLSGTTMRGLINVTNVGSESISDLNITFNGTDNLTGWPILYSAPVYLTNVGGPTNPIGPFVAGDSWWVYAATLKPGDSIIYNYSVTLTNNEPVNITQTYSSDKIIEGGSFTINMEVQNSLQNPVNVSNVKIIKTPGRYYDQAGNPVYFNYTAVGGPDAANAQLLPYDSVYRQLVWNVTALGNISPSKFGGSTYNLTIDVTAPSGLNGSFPTLNGAWENSTWGAYMLVGEVLINMTMEGSMSMFEIESVEGLSTAKIDVTKERINDTHWNTSVAFNNTADSIDYNLTRIRIWSTNFTAGAFNPENNVIAGSTQTSTPNVAVSNGSAWAGLSSSFAWDWVPVVWGDATYKILDDGTQVQKIVETRTIDNGYWYIEEIYVLKGGYLIKVSKEIDAISLVRNSYNVTIVLENIGTEKTPGWVSMFDLIPAGFELLNVSDNSISFGDRNMTGGTDRYAVDDVSLFYGIESFSAIGAGSYAGYEGYRVDFGEIMNGSNGNSQYDGGTSEVRFNYMINGTGDLSRVGNAYLVGVDPQRTDGSVSSTYAPNTGFFVSITKNVREQMFTFIGLSLGLFAIMASLFLKKKN
ncbi:hypothetical protein JXM83_02585 [Candidatus Woesearchaeota archaeon]|nr:hypothetical protein [Candidatus Woesearchaeota archaeon]